jgi:hypothetical protein
MSVTKHIESFNKTEKRAMTPDVEPSEWFLPNKVGYTKWVESTFHSIHKKDIKPNGEAESCDCKSEHCEVKVKKLELFPHQRFIRDYMQHKSPYRGLLLLHGLGTGKSCTSIAAAEMLMNYKEVFVLLPASLRSNYINEVRLCGHKYYTPRQYWKHIKLSEMKNTGTEMDIKYVDQKMITKHKGVWVPMPNRHPNFDSLTGVQQQQIVDQINHIIEKRYNFINYNGIQRQHLNDLTKEGTINPFDNKVIIIDEVHNFISRVIGRKAASTGSTIGKSPISKQLYNLIMKAENAKLVLLSGTPIINYAYEIAYLVNLIKGFTKVYEVPFKIQPSSKLTYDTMNDLLKQHPRIDSVRVDTKRNLAEFKLIPGAFIKGTTPGQVVYQQLVKDDHAIIQDIATLLLKENVKMTLKYKTKYYTPLPIDDKHFNDLFVNEEMGEIRNQQLFMRRILGSVSFFKASNEDLYPSIRKVETIKVPMSDYQFIKYTEARNEERKKEQTRVSKYGGDESSNSVFKAYSRAICNFAFPEEIKRPYPSKIGMMMKELDDFDDDAHAVLDKGDEETKIDKAKEYQKALTEAIAALHGKKDDYLRNNLVLYSPKYAAFVKNLQASAGSAMIYSQFRNVEGLGVLQLVLQAHGYAEFKLKKDKKGLYVIDMAEEDLLKPKYALFTSDKEMTEAILSVFNSDTSKMPANIRTRLEELYPDGTFNLRGDIIKLLMITQSGAEGISLKNVRQVHVLEPYWNQIRIDQVIGRAVRTCSHVALPPKDRNVDVFIYVATFTPKQLADNFTLRRQDKSMTSDESIVNVAERKNKLVTGLIRLMKQAAVDCQLNQSKQQRSLENLTCFSFPVNLDGDTNAITLDIVDEPLDKAVIGQQEKETIKPKKVIIKGTPYIYIASTNEIFDYESYVTYGSLQLLGYLEILEKGVYKLKMIKSKTRK